MKVEKSREENHYRALERMYAAAPINVFYQPRMSVGKARASIVMSVMEKYFHSAHSLHGSVYFKLLDDAAFFAANSLEFEYFVLTTEFQSRFLKMVAGGDLRAEGTIIFHSKRTIVAESKLYNDRNEIVAVGQGTFVVSRIRLEPENGYC